MNKRSFPEDWPEGTAAKSKRNSSGLTPKTGTDVTESEIIELAWCDETTFDSIQSQTGRSEQEVIKLMRSRLKPSSFKLWRKRVSGRPAKHAARSNQRLKKIS
ncbi:MAG: TIGR03643 family protein [Lentilitoribacter sp.]